MIYHPKHILITGGAGFIGANFIYYLEKHLPECTIVNLDALTYAASLEHLQKVSHPSYHFVKGNICDKPLIETLLKKFNIDTIVHFAAESHVDRSINTPDNFIQTNLVGTFTLLEAARHYFLNEKKGTQENCRFHHVSTDEVFGELNESDPLTTENDPYRPNSPYSASKAGSDHLVRAYQHTYHLPCTLTHCSNNYGPFQHSEKFIPTVINACLKNEIIPIYGDGKNKRDWLYVEDHCSGILHILRHGIIGENYNIGSMNEWSNLDLSYFICHTLNKISPSSLSYEKQIQFVTDRLGHDWRYALSIKKIQSLGWEPKISFETGLKKTIEYYIRHTLNKHTDKLSS
ncbi:MAG: hypothetical protein ACD_44C00092G0002 [uncultured bacterium]|nr:MAG: hypothetical protein ACD_44C00092G0002 [uncultured bacterium]